MERNDFLSLNGKASPLKRACKNCLVNGFEKSRAQVAMNVQRNLDYCSSNVIQVTYHFQASVVAAAPRERGMTIRDHFQKSIIILSHKCCGNANRSERH